MPTSTSFQLWLRLAPAAVWNLGIAAAFLITWFAPYALGERTVHKLTFLMLVEFLVVHSAGFFAAIAGPSTTQWMDRRVENAERAEQLTRALMFGGLMLFYCLFAGMFALMYGGPWPFLAFMVVALPKIVSGTFNPADGDGQFMAIATWAAMTALYVILGAATTIAPMPAFGITASVIETQQFTVEGLWPEEPYRVMAFGFSYFVGLAIVACLFELAAFRKEHRALQPE